VLKRPRDYDPVLDKRAKMEELRLLYKAMNSSTGKGDVGGGSGDSLSDRVSTYFEWEQMKEKSSSSNVTTHFYIYSCASRPPKTISQFCSEDSETSFSCFMH